jgi:hypothetical protein
VSIEPDSFPAQHPVSRREFGRAGLSIAALLSLPGVSAKGNQTGNGDASTTDAKPVPAPTQDRDTKKPEEAKPEEAKPVQLFDPATFPKNWEYFAAEKDNPIEKTWQVAKDEKSNEPYLKCLGKPYGFIRTVDQYENFEFGLQWRFPTDPNGNSGVLLYTVEPDRIWPNAVQLQLHRPKAGSVFPIGEARTDNRLDIKEKELSKPLNVWNECVVTCVNGRISVVINNRKVGEVTGCVPLKGAIALQSEGSEIHFQKIWLKKLS